MPRVAEELAPASLEAAALASLEASASAAEEALALQERWEVPPLEECGDRRDSSSPSLQPEPSRMVLRSDLGPYLLGGRSPAQPLQMPAR